MGILRAGHRRQPAKYPCFKPYQRPQVAKQILCDMGAALCPAPLRVPLDHPEVILEGVVELEFLGRVQGDLGHDQLFIAVRLERLDRLVM